MRKLKIIIAAMLLMSPLAANAGLISFGSVTASNPNKFEDFERLGIFSSSEILTNQFAANGINFSVNAGQAPVLFNNSFCRPGMNNFSGSAYAAIGVTVNCGVATNTVDSVSILFDDLVTELSFDYTSNNPSAYTLEALLDGSIVSSLAISRPPLPSTTTILYTGSVFNEIRFNEGGGNNWFWIDDLAWESSVSVASVPEPTTLALLGLGFAGMGLTRRRKKV